MDEQEKETGRDPSIPSPNSAGAEETDGSSETAASAHKTRVSVTERLQTITGALQALALALVALTAVFVVVPTLRHAMTNAFGSQPKTSQSLRPRISPAKSASDKSTPSTPSGCPDETSSYYVKPVTLLGSGAYSLKFCSVDVNDGQPIGLSYTLSGKVIGTPPSNISLAIVSEPDPATCDLTGNPGNGDFYFQEEINPAVNDGIWQLGEPASYPGSQTIRHNIYFVVGPEAALLNLKNNPTTAWPSNLIRLAYITVQGRIPPGHTCRQAG
jgi:hypothetical protein